LKGLHSSFDGIRSIHLLGIGGAGMSGLAILLKELGFIVSGCDMNHTSYVDKILKEGIAFELGHGKDHIVRFKPDLIVYSSAIPHENAELEAAKALNVPTAKRGEVLSWIFDMKIGIGIAGTHGKTTTSSMIGMIFEHAGLNPTLAIGGEVCDIGVNAKLGSGEFMVAELDESDGSFERFHPSISVVTNADWDHVNQYPSFESVVEAFGRFLGNVKKGGCAILCGEDRGLSRLIELGRTDCSVVTYGWGSEWDWGASNVVHLQGGGVNFTVTHNGQSDEHMELSVSGDHNIMNALAARIVAYNAGISFDIVKSTLKEFKGAKRRLQLTGVFNDILIYDDYGHHPREISATLSALKQMFPQRKIVTVFQPHRFTRTAALYKDFAESLSLCEEILLLPIYPADEEPVHGISSKLIADARPCSSSNWTMCDSMDNAVEYLHRITEPGSVVLTIGAGDVVTIGEKFLEDSLCLLAQ
jgi:UDP-N-acetylmuramate--alanine ligase